MATSNLSSPLAIEQTLDGYRYSIEPFLLVNFASLSTGSRLLDIGTGCGIIPLLASRQVELGKITAIEIQKSLYDLAVINMSKNGISNKVSLVHGDFTDSTLNSKDGLFDTVISNPPYRKLNTGRMNPSHEKAVARHEIYMNLNSLLTKTSSLLKYGGALVMAYPPIRLKEVQETLCSHKFFPSRLRFIHGSREADARIFLIESVKNRQVECVIEPPLFVYNKDGSYSKEMEKVYASFNYSSWGDNIQQERYRDRIS
jgi:tRNA1Val (adenine37-N6)-methyltransferase